MWTGVRLRVVLRYRFVDVMGHTGRNDLTENGISFRSRHGSFDAA